MIIFCGFERRPHDVHGDLTATLPLLFSTPSEHRTNAGLRRPLWFKVVDVGSRPEQFSATSLRSLGSLLRPSGVYGVLSATWVAVRTQ
ncbi:hypothetical protein DPMN_078741 [Dreissena polymorpha]|uniref:Uncharacterized protein n=1 Tax=Dreissena polymorpha TaxID=45954 RepID=A0A9D4BPF4_DREPO|nr:hypothetical protein DPMN_078741 [Dreissena polymorpha]